MIRLRPVRALRRALLPTLLLLLGAAAESRAGEPVVVELFTSQGCSSCPPADAYLAELADEPGVVALSLHVDYWDYLGWRDVHARAAFTKRQIAYRDVAGARSVYTPQMVVHGADQLVGSRRGEVRAALARAAGAAPGAEVKLMREGGDLWAEITARGGFPGKAVVWLVGYETRPAVVAIRRGENAGRPGVHRNVVRSWMKLGKLRAGETAKLMAPTPEGVDGVAVIVQHGRVGPVLGAAKLEF